MPRPLTPLFDPVTRHGRRAPNPIAYSLASGDLTDVRDTAAGTGTAIAAIFDTCVEAVQQWVVPAGVTSVRLTAAGARASDYGGTAAGTFSVTPGETLDIYVGCIGEYGAGGWPNGGNPGPKGPAGNTGMGGGGASYVVAEGGSMATALVVGGASGGRGGVPSYAGGAGGYPTGADGTDAPVSQAGHGGSQVAGGAAGVSAAGAAPTAGAFDQGGNGGGGSGNFGDGGGGGGGGWYGGGGGGGTGSYSAAGNAGGGGGSSHTAAAGSNAVYVDGINPGNGYVTIAGA